ncbi:hypothetical protein [Candidatus Methanoperedens nitratireducens]|uniref:Uncharacterized protein n=1 Tax=Candidatus Methanoperedens nitratireducens TaxID=1392998 RepID=A0A284VU49_9EURY|nr:hypothetical protein [Candidatus Methanoperedens nitroreducens]SNQ62826.1 hypothetical protein MNV_900005 [Candidatus Methanoperedens nitroreducens]
MEFKEINVPEGIFQQIGEGPFADITVDAGDGDHIYPKANPDVLYENTLEDIEKMLGQVPGFMKLLPKKVLIHNWSSWKRVEEINMERARYLLNTDEMLEEMLSGTQG